jgi:fused signal recognition particle receptor
LDFLVYLAIGAAVIAAVYFLFFNKKDEPQVEAAPEPRKLPSKDEAKAKAKAKAEPAKKEPAKKAEPAKTSEPAKKIASPAKVDDDGAEDEDEDHDESPAAAAKPEAKGEPKAERATATPGPAAPRRPRDVAGLRKGLAKARDSEGLFGRLRALFGGKKEIDPQIVEQLEEVLLTSDVGVKTTAKLLDGIKDRLSRSELKDDDAVWTELRESATRVLDIGGGGLALAVKPTVVMVVGVNGVGKTTTIGKLATRLKAQGKTVVLAAGDTFRAAAVQQLKVWGDRVGCEVVKGKDGANPGAVIFDAIQRAKEIGADVVLADTAGRLHTKTNLMEELKKVHRTMDKAMEGAPHETLLVLDATNGQNALQQAALFKEALPLTGLVLTKLDGTAKGGVVLGVCAEHELPVRYIGVGERSEDLRDFDAGEFVEALLGTSGDSTSEAA